MSNPKRQKCISGHHDYSEEETKDKRGQVVRLCKHCKRSGYEKCGVGTERWHDYDKNGTCIYTKCSDGHEGWFNKKGNLTLEKHPYGYEARYYYNDAGYCIRVRCSDGEEIWLTPDDKGNCIHEKSSNVVTGYKYEVWYGYDEKGNMIYEKWDDGRERWCVSGHWVYEKPENWKYDK